ncbi:apolipoprotein N-acyltransferase [Kribbella sp. VKM Ac-2568]|uniref:apolipoprotein N-acyltransferase n=1 Tax=Kribbella sp. VKM Ac-2568 TaxID=2512219 RepID=UPI00105172A3|nr:apolipoprotein N-acyltransferase [Kribbella sp. VKM Ac-2568]TCM40337.1 apolipoprotein N-acyltransferase [Kribbella sp. VKM Ac-2568]
MERLKALGRILPRLIVAVGAGALLGLAFEPHDHPWLAFLAVPLLLAALNGVSMKAGFLIGSGFGITYYAVLVPWLSIIGGDAAIALAILEGLFYGVFGMFASQTLKHKLWILWVPCLWVATEFATASVPFGGFPWGRLAWAFADSPLGKLASLVGIPGLSFAVALIGVLLYAVLRRKSGLGLRAVALVGAIAIFGGASLISLSTEGNGKDVTAAMVQGNVPGKGLEFLGRARTVTRNHLTATLDLQKQVEAGTQLKPDVVIWPENSTDIDPYKDAETRQDIEEAVKAVNVPILVGAVLEGPGPNERQTTGIVWDPVKGAGQRYAKRHPVPFGEYIPFRDQLLPYIKRLEMVGRQTAPGKTPGVLPINGVTYGDVICFEVAYDGVVADVMKGGAQILVVQTNNATYGGTGQPEQQFAITRMRAIETGRTVLIASTSGISGVIQPDGKVEHKSSQFVPDVYVAQVPVRDAKTLATTLGGWPQWILTGLGIMGAVLALFARRRRRDGPETPPASTPSREKVPA